MYVPESPERQMLRQSIRRFLDRECPREKVRQWDEQDHYPLDVVVKLRELGIFGLTTPEEYGGAGRDIPAAMIALEELSRRCLSLGYAYLFSAVYGAINIYACGNEAQKRALLPKLATGEIGFAYGLSEPNVGADLAAVETYAELDGDSFIVNGAKRWCTGAGIVDYIFVLLRSDLQAPRYKNLSMLMIDPTLPGITIEPIKKMGNHGAKTCDVTFDNVRVPKEQLLGGMEMLHQGWAQLAGPALDVEKIEVSAIALGIGQAAYDDAFQYAQERRQFGKAIAAHQSIRHLLADMATDLFASRLMVYHCAQLYQEEQPCGVETGMAKLFVSEAATRIALNAQKILGAYGYAMEYDVQRYVRDVLLTVIAGGSSAIQRNNISGKLGLAKS
ncbi:MAG: acyl-CoA dehydrogenase family protein [Candidatus Binatia bacterium]